MFPRDYHRNLQCLHIGCEKPHAYFIPYNSIDAAKTGDRERSEFFRNLCGTWDFRYYSSLNDVEDFTDSRWEMSPCDTLRVPMNWQMALGRGYDIPHYTNHNYPFPVDPPHLPNDIPCGLYRRRFNIEADDLKKSIRMVFEGVDSCFYLYINDQFVGYSQVSHCTSEFIIDRFLREGENEVKVLVLKWCCGSYLEDQDKYRLSGIFREVYLLLRDKACLTDMYVRCELDARLKGAKIYAELETNARADIYYELYAPDGASLKTGTLLGVDGKATAELFVDKPLLWSDETPWLYKLCLSIGEEHICREIGIRRFEVRGKILYVNGKKVKGKGVNRHDSHPRLGYVATLEDMTRDLYILKANNINMVRTSHYPNDPRFLELCDRIGLYVCEETDLETHGMNDYGNWSLLTDSEEWSHAYLDRVERMFESAKNHVCVLMWSLGNESGDGINHKKMADYLHSRAPGCIVHSDGVTRTRFFDYMEAKTAAERRLVDCEFVDIETRMYLSPEACIRYYVKNRNIKKPFFLCEYAHAMGNSPGDLEAYWQTIYSHDGFFGACVWEMADHSVDIGTEDAPKYTYGGDLGDHPNDKNFCVDGLLYPDRRPHTGMLEYKQVLRPVRVVSADLDKASVTLRNYRYFTDLSDMDLVFSISRNGRVIESGRINKLAVRPQQNKTYQLPIQSMDSLDGFCYLELSFRSNTERPWAGIDYEWGFEQIEIPAKKVIAEELPKSEGQLCLCEEDKNIRITDGDTEYVIDRISGLLSTVNKNGRQVICTPLEPTIWRAPTDNDRYVRQTWEKEGYHRMVTKCYSCTVVRAEEGSICVESRLSMSAVAKRPLIHI